MKENTFNKMNEYIDSLVTERRITRAQARKLHDMLIEACGDAWILGIKQEEADQINRKK